MRKWFLFESKKKSAMRAELLARHDAAQMELRVFVPARVSATGAALRAVHECRAAQAESEQALRRNKALLEDFDLFSGLQKG